jgi:hypothetical protein
VPLAPTAGRCFIVQSVRWSHYPLGDHDHHTQIVANMMKRQRSNRYRQTSLLNGLHL